LEANLSRLAAVPSQDSEEGRQRVRHLVSHFERNRAHYQSPTFDEASTREYFINPFFEALGWDVRDEAGVGARRAVIYHRRLVSTPEVAGLAAWE
jgi:hypothetical protein